jgi:hypothetical protein
MRNAAPLIKTSLALSALVLSLTASAAASKAASVSPVLPDDGSFSQATREQIQQGEHGQATPCSSATLNEALHLIYNAEDLTSASLMARRCEAQAVTQGEVYFAQIGLRIKALIAMKTRDMDALKLAGEAMVKKATNPEHEGDGHMFLAFACLFSNQASCARSHVELARVLFTRAQVSEALEQLHTMEQALAKLEATSTSVEAAK